MSVHFSFLLVAALTMLFLESSGSPVPLSMHEIGFIVVMTLVYFLVVDVVKVLYYGTAGTQKRAG